MTAHAPRWISESDVVELMNLHDAIEALTHGLMEEAAGSARNMEKTAAHWGNSSNMHAIGAVFEGADVFGTKTWGNTPAGSTPLLILWHATAAKLLAIIEARALGQMRTAAMSGIATKWMSEERADDLAIIGSGKQALTQVAAIAAVRRLRRVRVFSPTPAKRNAFAEKLRSTFPAIEIRVADDAASATDGASIITLITRAREPVISSSMVARGAHVNAAGAITRERREFAQDLFPRATLVAVDTLPATRALSAEFIDWYDGKCRGDWTSAQRISDIVAAGRPRPAHTDLSLFKPMGMGISDVSLGIEIIRRAEASAIGRTIPAPGFATPRISNITKQETAA
jgi:ornithine cyclodeaminase/alanine dehydrogenase-like protein (mu-crystallin family)